MPVEVFETKYPVQIKRYGFRPDSGGPGEFRGGCGLYREYELGTDCNLYLWFERSRTPAWGLLGARDAAGPVVKVRSNGSEQQMLKVNKMPCRAGDTLTVHTGGGGGYGDPLTRDSQAVLRDVLAGYVTREGAERDYGVVIGPDLKVDPAATARKREELAGNRSRKQARKRKG